MRIRTAIGILSCCCAALTACTAAAPKGPATTVTTPHVGKPPPPVSVDAALAHAPLTPYVLLGTASNDGLAPNESGFALAGACMTAAGYLNAASEVPMGFRIDPGLGISMAWGEWGYLGLAQAEQSDREQGGQGDQTDPQDHDRDQDLGERDPRRARDSPISESHRVSPLIPCWAPRNGKPGKFPLNVWISLVRTCPVRV